ncbi:hypothetical protein [Pseudomonas sp. F(2018)]|uniref:hypothetical protein n=1 Tax=Pseudomonas sp. F(2018) TaxID=2502240 RepID=UPI0010F5F9A8|nr:hypothetical protein [Pseudomonas sp. F(2018)]
MPRLTLVQTNFTAGEISPRMLGRTDIARYQNGAETMENCWPVVHGGGVRRDGTLFCAAAKYDNKRARLIPYVFNRSQAYMVEFGDLYVRFYYPDGTQIESSPGVPLELVSPYTEAMLFGIGYVQGADTMFLAHQSMPMYRLRRVSNTEWTLSQVPFVAQPFDETGHKPAVSLTLASSGVGAGVAVTASGSVFLAADVGREIWYGPGIATITAVASGTSATVTISTAFNTTAIPSGAWRLTGSPRANCTPSAKDPVGAAVTLTLALAGWRAEDAGKYVRINRGIVQITTIASATVANGIITSALDSAIASISGAWSLEGSVWSVANGYPGAVTLHEQRLVCAGSPEFPQTVWMSRIGEYLNFELGTKDDDAMSFTVSSDQINPIVHMGQVRTLIALTYGGEFTLSGGVEKPITPTNIQVKNQSVYGCNPVRPVRIGNELYFMQRANRKLRAMAYKYDSDAYGSPDMSVLSEHITESGVVDMAYQQERESLLFLVRADGVLATLTADRDQDVVGWARQITDGAYESVASIPASDGEQVWVLVKRTINGVEKRYVERFTSGVHVDCGIVGSSGPGAETWSGLGHLEGKLVDIVADGVPMQPMTVTGGSITLPRKAYEVQIGLHYKTTIKTLTPEVQGSSGSMQGNSMRIGEITLRFYKTIGCKINGQTVAFRGMGEQVLDQPPALFTGDHRMENLGWERGRAQLLIEQDQPLPFHLLCVIKKITFND